MIFFSCKNKKVFVFFMLLSYFFSKAEYPTLNNADFYPIYSSHSLLRDIEIDKKKNGVQFDDCDCNRDFARVEIFPFFQTATSGTNYRGEDTLTYYDYSNLNLVATSNASAQNLIDNTSGVTTSSGNNNDISGLVYTVPMPLGAIPEPFNFLSLFYTWAPRDTKEDWIYGPEQFLGPTIPDADTTAVLTSGKSWGNIVPKIIARYLGYGDVPYKKKEGETDPSSKDYYDKDPLKFNYQNYRNPNYFALQDEKTRDPKKLFGYGYFDMSYKKYGVRGSVDIYPFETKNLQIRFKGGYAHLDVDKIKLLDTTSPGQGPTSTNMYVKYDENISIDNNTDDYPDTPNLYQINDYAEFPSDNNLASVIRNEFLNSITGKYKADNFKSSFMQNVQNNLDEIGRILNQDFTEYHVNGLEDIVIDVLFKNDYFINNNYSSKKMNDIFASFYATPFISLGVTAPTSKRTCANKFFAKPIGNNGHWGYNGKVGVTFDFPCYLAVNLDVGLSIFDGRHYTNVPVPTKELEEGIYTYSADLYKTPGESYTFGFGLQSDLFSMATSFWGEYRFVHHTNDRYKCVKMKPLLKEIPIDSIYYNKAPYEILSTNPEVVSVPGYPEYRVKDGVLYIAEDEERALPYPTDILYSNAEALTPFTVHMINLGFKWNINPDTCLNINWQQPFSMVNAYNSTTIGISLEILM